MKGAIFDIKVEVTNLKSGAYHLFEIKWLVHAPVVLVVVASLTRMISTVS